MAPSSRVLTRGPSPAKRVGCACPNCETPLRPERAGRYRCPRCQVVLDLWITEAAVRDRQPAAAPLALAPAGEDQPACVGHPQNASVVACSRCGDFICEVCRIQIEGRELCPACFERGVDKAELKSVKRQFRQPEFALGLGALSIPGGCLVSYFAAFVGLVAIGVGIQALMKIHKQPALGGKGKAIAGIILGSIGFLMWVLVFVLFVVGAFYGNRFAD
jgi:uncharacterized paraquat-inducible protein A